MIETILLFIVTLLFVVLIHETGHFIASKRVGVAVEEFGLGFPPRIFGKMWKGTLYSINVLPIGAFVRSPGENDPSIEGSLASQSPWRRFVVYVSGPGANILLGFVLFTVFFALPRAMVVSDGVLVYEVQPGSAADQAGMLPGDVITNANGAALETYSDLQAVLAGVAPPEAVELTIARDGANLPVKVVPAYSDELGRNVIGITLGRNVVAQVTPGSPADEAGIAPGDSVLGVGNVAVLNEAELDSILGNASGAEPVVVTMLRGNTSYTAELSGAQLNTAGIGLDVTWVPGSRVETRAEPVWTAAAASARYIISMPALIVASVPLMREDPSLAFVGPIGAGQLTVEAVQVFGPSNLIFIGGLISIGIALFNLIPVPPLDGGGILVALVEAVRRGKRLSERSVRLAYAIGTSLLITLVVLITTSDLLRLIQGRGFGL